MRTFEDPRLTALDFAILIDILMKTLALEGIDIFSYSKEARAMLLAKIVQLAADTLVNVEIDNGNV